MFKNSPGGERDNLPSISGDLISSVGFVDVLYPPTIDVFSVPEAADEDQLVTVRCSGTGTPVPRITVTSQVC